MFSGDEYDPEKKKVRSARRGGSSCHKCGSSDEASRSDGTNYCKGHQVVAGGVCTSVPCWSELMQ